jgi:hypothetical protein
MQLAQINRFTTNPVYVFEYGCPLMVDMEGSQNMSEYFCNSNIGAINW